MNEMIDWLDNWLPLNMTGQIEFYYLDRADSDVFINSLMVSDVAALTSEGLSDNKDIYRSYMTQDTAEIEYYKRKFEGLIDLSEKMIDIIGEDNNLQSGKENEYSINSAYIYHFRFTTKKNTKAKCNLC